MLRIVESARPVRDEPPRHPEDVAAALRQALERGELELPLPGRGETARRWAELAGYGRRDLALARLVEGHADATAILHEAGEKPEPNALYGVWASRAAGKGAVLSSAGADAVLTGTVPFCSGADLLDRALIVARPEGAGGAEHDVVFDLVLDDSRVCSVPDTWQATGMAASRTLDVELRELPVDGQEHIGPAGFYTARPGFRLGGAGVAAVWLGGAVGLHDRVLDLLTRRGADEHQLAHIAAMHVALLAAESALDRAAATVDDSEADPSGAAATCRSAVEHAARQVLERAPRVSGPGPLTRDPVFSRRLADLEVYVRQHHGERELAELGRRVLHDRAGGIDREP
ncbi:alkylation response protein AidB-like acyl-CoA dehydrogenase [Actinopolyspora biskrensis]|uniref:Alkylation response protein AidB-like acyl-CoA dehydrogenase n=1 Tax=Actinopolyspora biskrensis TaxID=1470178 RepID=A0A852YX88_9ACTN|nr:alkylation response protein AidB-like acyl-CoA dehydrogenase [Actinopolyspora biskrensis]